MIIRNGTEYVLCAYIMHGSFGKGTEVCIDPERAQYLTGPRDGPGGFLIAAPGEVFYGNTDQITSGWSLVLRRGELSLVVYTI